MVFLTVLPRYRTVFIPAGLSLNALLPEGSVERIPSLQTVFVAMSHGNIVNMQVRCLLIQVHNRIKHVQVRIPLFEFPHVVIQYLLTHSTLFRSDTAVTHIADLYQILIKEFLAIFRGSYLLHVPTDSVNAPVCSFLLRVVLCNSLLKAVPICIFQALTFIGDIVLDSVSVHIICHELTVVVIQRAFSFHDRYACLCHNLPPFWSCYFCQK